MHRLRLNLLSIVMNWGLLCYNLLKGRATYEALSDRYKIIVLGCKIVGLWYIATCSERRLQRLSSIKEQQVHSKIFRHLAKNSTSYCTASEMS